VLPVKLGGRVVPESILRDIQVFVLFYLLTFLVGAAVVVMLGADLLTPPNDDRTQRETVPGS